MKHNKKLINYLAFGSLLLLVIFFASGCKKNVIRDHYAKANWIYMNNSSYDITIRGIQRNPLAEKTDVLIKSNDVSQTEFIYDSGDNEVPSDYFPLPYYDNCVIIINNIEYSISNGEYFRDRASYNITKREPYYYQFNYTFTDDVITEIRK